MYKLLLSAKGLFYRFYNETSKKNEEIDVSDRAQEFLSERIELGAGVRLRDVFNLFITSPMLLSIYRRDFAQEFMQAFHKCTFHDNPPEYDSDGIEYLEVYQVWEHDSSEGVLTGKELPNFHGIGFELKEERDGFSVGQRIPFSLSFATLDSLINLPLFVNEEVEIRENDIYSTKYGSSLLKTTCALTLNDLIHAIFWELSFYGSPEECEAEGNKLKEIVADLHEEFSGPSDTEEGVSESRFMSLEEALGLKDAIPEFFEIFGPVQKLEIDRFLRTVEDFVKMGDVEFPKELNVRIKDEYKNTTARNFREEMSRFEVS